LPKALPQHGHERWLSTQEIQTLDHISALTIVQIDTYLQSGDANLIGVAIYALDAQQNSERLFSLAALLDDSRVTLPRVMPGAGIGQIVTTEQTVRELLTRVYEDWFGLHIESKAAFDIVFSGIVDSTALIHPWGERLRRARKDPDAQENVLMAIDALQDPQRIAIISYAFGDELIGKEQALQHLKGIESGTLSKSLCSVEWLAADPSVSKQFQMGDRIHAAFRSLFAAMKEGR